MSDVPACPSGDVRTVDSPPAVCDGGGELGHPRVYLAFDGDDRVTCPYCSQVFVLAPGARTGRGH